MVTVIPKAGALDLVSHDTTVSEDKLTDMTQPMFQKVQSHLPFAHSQSTDIVQLKQDMFHIDSKCLRKRWHEQSCQQSVKVDRETFEDDIKLVYFVLLMAFEELDRNRKQKAELKQSNEDMND